jgi:hypothetical protein
MANGYGGIVSLLLSLLFISSFFFFSFLFLFNTVNIHILFLPVPLPTTQSLQLIRRGRVKQRSNSPKMDDLSDQAIRAPGPSRKRDHRTHQEARTSLQERQSGTTGGSQGQERGYPYTVKLVLMPHEYLNLRRQSEKCQRRQGTNYSRDAQTTCFSPIHDYY